MSLPHSELGFLTWIMGLVMVKRLGLSGEGIWCTTNLTSTHDVWAGLGALMVEIRGLALPLQSLARVGARHGVIPKQGSPTVLPQGRWGSSCIFCQRRHCPGILSFRGPVLCSPGQHISLPPLSSGPFILGTLSLVSAHHQL